MDQSPKMPQESRTATVIDQLVVKNQVILGLQADLKAANHRENVNREQISDDRTRVNTLRSELWSNVNGNCMKPRAGHLYDASPLDVPTNGSPGGKDQSLHLALQPTGGDASPGGKAQVGSKETNNHQQVRLWLLMSPN